MITKNPKALPETCPAVLAELLQAHDDDRQKVANMLDVTKSHLGKVVNGTDKLPEKMEASIKKLLPKEGGAEPALKPDVVITQRRSNLKGLPDWAKGADPLIIKLLEKFEYNRSASVAAIGSANSVILKEFASGKRRFTDTWKERVEAALRGEPIPVAKVETNEELDKYTLGLAIVVATAAEFERLYDLGQALDGKWLFKFPVRGIWIAFLKTSSDKLKTYKKVALRDAIAIVCP